MAPPRRRRTIAETPLERLASLEIGEPVAPWVAQRIAAGKSWRSIAEDLSKITGGSVEIPHQTLVHWYDRHIERLKLQTPAPEGTPPDGHERPTCRWTRRQRWTGWSNCVASSTSSTPSPSTGSREPQRPSSPTPRRPAPCTAPRSEPHSPPDARAERQRRGRPHNVRPERVQPTPSRRNRGAKFSVSMTIVEQRPITSRRRRGRSVIVAVPARDPGEHHSYITEIAALAQMVDVWQRLLADHVPDRDGMCAHRSCGRPGYGTPYVTWPCTTWVAADNAAHMHGRRWTA